MSEVFAKYKSYIYPILLSIIYVVCIILTWGKWGHIIADCFREMVIPQAILEGKILYSDITNLYSPLAYWLNAGLFSVFGDSLNVLYFAGIFNSFVILSVLYFLTKKYSSDFVAFIVTLTVIEIFTFRINMLNSVSWIFPYSYSFIYAFSTCLLALVSYVLYKENLKLKYLFLSFLFIGLSVAFKLDFLLFALVPLFEIIKNKSFKQFLIALICFVIPTGVTFGAYLLTGGTISALLNQFDFLSEFSKAPSVISFNKLCLPQKYNIYVLQSIVYSIIAFVSSAVIILLCSSGVVLFLNKINNRFFKIFLSIIFAFLGYVFVIKNIAKLQFVFLGLHANLVCIPYFVAIIALVIFFLKRKEKNYTNIEKFYFLLTISGILMAYRLITAVFISYIGNFIMTIFWLAFILFCYEILPKYFEKFKNSNYRKILTVSFISFGLIFSSLFVFFAQNMTYKIKSSKGTFYTSKTYALTCNDAIDFIEKNISNDETLLVMDEGLIFNYLTDRKTNLKYYALIPHMIDTFGEEKIIEDLSINPPDFAFITNNVYPTKLGGKFGINYAKKITAFFFDNYEYVQSIMHPEMNNGLEIAVLKRKK